jgi:hypothetical protein
MTTLECHRCPREFQEPPLQSPSIPNRPWAAIGVIVNTILDPLKYVAAFDLNYPTGKVSLPSHWLPQALQSAFPLSISSPQKLAVVARR